MNSIKPAITGVLMGLVALLGFQAPAHAQFKPGSEGVGVASGGSGNGPGGPATSIEVRSTGPGTADLVFSSVNVNFLNGLPDGMKAFWTDADMSDSAQTANIVAVAGHERAFAGLKACIRGVGADWGTVVCSRSAVASTVTIPIVLPASGKFTFAFVPTLEGRGEPLWVTHADNARHMLPCGNRQVMASLLTSDAGVIRLPTDSEVDQYAANPQQFWCP